MYRLSGDQQSIIVSTVMLYNTTYKKSALEIQVSEYFIIFLFILA